MNKSLFLKVLFENGEGICSGGYKAVTVSNNVVGNFFCINPLKDKRSDKNVTVFRNFLFEMDSVSLSDQLKAWQSIEAPISSLVYSGGKSYHAIVSLQEPLTADIGTDLGVRTYKAVWEQMRGVLEAKIEGAIGCFSGGFLDVSCKNPSRLSRVPGEIRNNGNLQELIKLNKRISKNTFKNYFGFNYDNIEAKKLPNVCNNVEVEDVQEFWSKCPIGLKNELRYVDWADSAGMYPKILKLTYWAIDSTGVPKDVLVDALWERTFPRLLDAGYPGEKLTVAVDHAYNEKRRS